MIIKISKYISVLALVIMLFSFWLYPEVSLALGIISLSFNLALSIYAIFKKHKGTENARAKILKEVCLMALTFIVIIFLGGIAAMLANYQVGMRWGEVAGLLSAIGASFGVGYLVRAGMMKLNR